MTTRRSNAGQSPEPREGGTETRSGATSTRGRGLDALFERAPEPAAGPDGVVAADLAALLDVEVRDAQGAQTTGRARSAAPAASLPPPEEPAPTIDVPPRVAEAVPTGGLYAETLAAAPRPAASEPAGRIDVPPTVAEARPATPSGPVAQPPATPAAPPAAAPTSPAAEPAPPPTEPTGPLPVTKRFGAIIMDTSATAPAEGGPAAMVLRGEAAKAMAPAGPGAEPEPQPPPAAIERTDDQKTIIIKRLDDVLNKDWQRELHKQIDDLYKQVAVEFNSPPANAQKALTLLREARQILIETPEEYVAAEYRTVQVRAMLARTRESRKQSRHHGPRILGYQIGWLLLLVVGFAFAGPLATLIAYLSGLGGATVKDFLPIWNTMMWGGIGGVIGALYHLWWHISDRQDFDAQYTMWYMVQPIMGLVLGGIVFLLLAGGLLVLQVDPLSTTNTNTATRLLPYLLAVLAGFRQNFIYEQFDRLIALFTPGSQRDNQGGGGQTGGQ